MPTGSNSVLPQQISDVFLGDTVVQLSCGSFHSLLLTSAGEVFSWGSNGSGQLGHPQTSELVRNTWNVMFSKPYKQNSMTFSHIFIYQGAFNREIHRGLVTCNIYILFYGEGCVLPTGNKTRLPVHFVFSFFLDSAQEGPL